MHALAPALAQAQVCFTYRHDGDPGAGFNKGDTLSVTAVAVKSE